MKVRSPDKVRKLTLASLHRISISCFDIVGIVGFFFAHRDFFFTRCTWINEEEVRSSKLGARPALVHYT